MKILFIVTLSELGGAQKYVRDLAVAYAQEGHGVIVAAGGDPDGWLFKQLESLHVKRFESEKIKDQNVHTCPPSHIHTYFLSHLKRSTGFFREFKTLFDIISIIHREKPNVLHLNSTKVGGLGGVAGRLNGVKSVYTVHGLVLNEPLHILLWSFYWLLEKIAFAVCNKIIVISKYDEQRVLQFHLAQKRKLSLIPLTVDPEQLNFLPRGEARKSLVSRIMEHVSKNSSSMFHVPCSMIVGTVANFYPTKDLATFIDAAKIVIAQRPPLTKGGLGGVKFVIIGDGPLRKDLELRVTRYGLRDFVFLLGRLPNSSQYLPGLDLFALSSVKEGLPQVLWEAAAAGIPVVSTNVGGIPDIYEKNFSSFVIPDIDRESKKENVKQKESESELRVTSYELREPNWILIPPRNPQLLAEKILFALENLSPNPPKSKETLRKEFREFVTTTRSSY